MDSLTFLAQRALLQSRHTTRTTPFLRSLRTLPTARSLSTLRPVSHSPLLSKRSLRLQLDHRLPSCTRYNSSLTTSEPPSNPATNPLAPAYQLSFTCLPCSHRSSHRVTKQGYHHGTVLVTCPNCKNRHVIADHLKVFLDQASTLEDILQKANVDGKPLSSLLKKGKLGIRQGSMVGNEGEEDIEFWEDGTETVHLKEKEVIAEQKSGS